MVASSGYHILLLVGQYILSNGLDRQRGGFELYLWLQGGLHFQNRQDQMESKSQTLNNNAEVDRSRILWPKPLHSNLLNRLISVSCWGHFAHYRSSPKTWVHVTPALAGVSLPSTRIWTEVKDMKDHTTSNFLADLNITVGIPPSILHDYSLEAGCAHWIPSQHTERTLGPACKIHASVISHPQTWALFRELESPSCPPYFVLVAVYLTWLQPSEKAWNIPSLFVNTPEFSPAYHLSSLPTLVMHLQILFINVTVAFTHQNIHDT
jgi:hypothetical protein